MPGDTMFYNMSFKDSNNQNIDITWGTYVDAGWGANLSGLSATTTGDPTVYLNTAN
jgi:hypothetical protein